MVRLLGRKYVLSKICAVSVIFDYSDAIIETPHSSTNVDYRIFKLFVL